MSSGYLGFVARMNTVDEVPVPLRVDRKVRAESSIDKRVDDIAEADKYIEAEAFDQQRQNVLRANTFKSADRAIPVEEFIVLPSKLTIVAVCWRDLAPELAHDRKRLRPSLMAISADHVGYDESPVRSESVGYSGEKMFQRQHMMQRMVSNDAIV